MNRKFTRREFGMMAGAGVAASTLAAPAIGQAKPKLVVVGGGPGGATVARYVAKDSKGAIDVTLIEANARHTTCFFSNLYIGGLRSFDSITHGYDKLKSDYGINVVQAFAIGVDAARRTVTVAGGETFSYDKLVVAPGIDFEYDAYEGYSKEVAETFPHAWQAGPQSQILRRQLEAMEDGGVFLIAPPPNPFRCPPGPYERISLVAQYLKQNKPRSKIIAVDAKDKFSKQALFQEGWARHYEGMIEWLPLNITGGVKKVDVRGKTLHTGGESFKGDVINIIPPQRAGAIALAAGLANESGWCPIDPFTMASTRVPHAYVIGDSSIAAQMPKSGFSANSQAKACAMAIRAALTGSRAFEPRYSNTCWSLIANGDGVKVGASYQATKEKIASTDTFISKTGEDAATRTATAEEAEGWYAGIVADIFG
ncbi:MAG: FAD-dependent oxidoreductase [Rhodospirillales bacterium]|nr:MAG: FAD-dependent oxidoreductase [Rhodospirillales bacterium]